MTTEGPFMDLEQRKAKADTIGKSVRASVPGATLELREAGDTLTIEGYASVTDTPYDMGWYVEQVRSGAFTKTLDGKPDVQLLVNHEGLPLARTLSGTMTLEEDKRGLKVVASVDPSDPDVDRLARKMRRGDIDQMSFAFRAVQQKWDEDYENREITELSIDRGDVSVVNQGANPATSVALRYAMTLDELRAGKTISDANMKILSDVLSMVATADDNVDEALVKLSGLMGVPNPDTDEMEPDADDAARSTEEIEAAVAALAERLERNEARRARAAA